MNILKSIQVLVLSACIWHLSGSTAQCVLTHPVLTLSSGAQLGADYKLGDGGHQYFFNLSSSGTISTVANTVGEGFAYYALGNATVFDVQYASTHPAFGGNLAPMNSFQTPLNTPFYIGYYILTYPNQPGGTPNANDGYGWAQLLRNANGLTLLDSALQNPSGGIIVGTTQAVPEPSTWGLLAVGALALLFPAMKRRNGNPFSSSLFPGCP